MKSHGSANNMQKAMIRILLNQRVVSEELRGEILANMATLSRDEAAEVTRVLRLLPTKPLTEKPNEPIIIRSWPVR